MAGGERGVPGALHRRPRPVVGAVAAGRAGPRARLLPLLAQRDRLGALHHPLRARARLAWRHGVDHARARGPGPHRRRLRRARGGHRAHGAPRLPAHLSRLQCLRADGARHPPSRRDHAVRRWGKFRGVPRLRPMAAGAAARRCPRDLSRMETVQHLMTGFAGAFTLTNLLFAFIGCVLGTLIGVLPGLGPAAGTAILIPLTFRLDATAAIIMLCAIYYGAMYGGTITSVLINVPGEAASVITCLDGFQMAKQGRGGAALAVAAIGSFIGGTIASLALTVVALPLARMALKFGPPEFFALML